MCLALYVLSCITCPMPHVLLCPTCLVLYVLLCSACLVPYVFSCITYLLPYVLSCLTCSRASCALCLMCNRVARVIPCMFLGCSCLILYVLLCSLFLTCFRCFTYNMFLNTSSLVAFMPCTLCAFGGLEAKMHLILTTPIRYIHYE